MDARRGQAHGRKGGRIVEGLAFRDYHPNPVSSTSVMLNVTDQVFTAARSILNNLLDASIDNNNWVNYVLALPILLLKRMNAQVFNKDIQHLQTAYKALGEVLSAYGDAIRASDIFWGYQNAVKEEGE